MSESKVDDRLARLFPDRGADARTAAAAAPIVAIDLPSAPAATPTAAAPSREPLIYSDAADPPPT